MVDKVKISGKSREIIGKKVKQLRRDGLVPAVIYGKDREPLSLELDAHDFSLLYGKAGGNTIVQLDIEKEGEDSERKNVLIHRVDRDPVTDAIVHADLLQISMKEKITASVPLRFVGDALAAIDLGGSLLTQKSEVEIECLPGDLLHEIEVDLSPLVDFDTVVHVSDLRVPEGVEIKDDLEETIAYVEPPRSEEELEALEEPIEEPEMPGAEGEEPSEETKEDGETDSEKEPE